MNKSKCTKLINEFIEQLKSTGQYDKWMKLGSNIGYILPYNYISEWI